MSSLYYVTDFRSPQWHPSNRNMTTIHNPRQPSQPHSAKMDTHILVSMPESFAVSQGCSDREVNRAGKVLDSVNYRGTNQYTYKNTPVFICSGYFTAVMSQTFK